jgi:dihydroorotate dehydrogenase (fumarate)
MIIYNAAGIYGDNCKLIYDNPYAGAVVTKSCTLEPFLGHPSPNYYEDTIGSFNCVGLKNKGFDFYHNQLSQLEGTKPKYLSIGHTSLEDTLTMIKRSQFDIELNLSCPNKGGVGYNLEEFKKVLEKVSSKNIGIKLPPFFYPQQFDQVSEILNNNKVGFIVCSNTIGNTLVMKNGKPLLSNTFGGMAGKYLKPLALSNVYNFHKRLPNLKIVGVGGISTGKDIADYVACGASAVQVGTHLKQNGVRCFEQLTKEFYLSKI